VSLLKHISRCLEIIAEFADLPYTKPTEKFATRGNVFLPRRHPEFSVKFPLLRDPLKALYIAQQTKAQRRDARKLDPDYFFLLRADPHFPFQVCRDSICQRSFRLGGRAGFEGINHGPQSIDLLPPHWREFRSGDDVSEEQLIFGMDGSVSLCLALVFLHPFLDLSLLLIQIALRYGLPVMADMKSEEIVGCRGDVIGVSMLAPDIPILAERVHGRFIRERVLAEERFDLFLVLSHLHH